MADISTERLEPASRVPEPQRQQPQRDSGSRSRRRPQAPPQEPEPAADPEAPPHQIDRLA